MSLCKGKLLFSLAKRSLSTTGIRSGGIWNKDWKAGPYPKTEEEIAAAAKKYNLMREEYAPIPDDGDGMGDYPDFEPQGVEERDPHYPWDYPAYRRNFNEPVHENFNVYTEDRVNPNMILPTSMTNMALIFLAVMGGWYLFFYAGNNTFFFPVKPKHMPSTGKCYKYPSKTE